MPHALRRVFIESPAVTPLARSSARRLVLLGLASLLIHAMLLWWPGIRLPHAEVPLPLLTAHLVPLPKVVAARPHKRHKQHRAPRPAPVPATPGVALGAPGAQSAVAAASSVEAASDVAAASSIAAASDVAAASSVAAASGAGYAETASKPPQLPRHARLRFSVKAGSYRLYAGEIKLDMEIADGRYTLHEEMETVGLARLIKRYVNTQDSRGTVSPEHGLRPDEFTEVKTDEHGTQRSDAVFDWAAHKVRFASGTRSPLPDGAQDMLSFPYQLSQLPYDKTIIPLAIVNGRKIEFYRLETSPEEIVVTAVGKLHTLHLTKLHKPGEEGMDVWLAREYRLLPVKIRYYNRDGSLAAEVMIKEIRASDE